MTVISCMVPKIWRATDIIFCHFGPFFAILPLYGPRKSKFWKNEQHSWRYYHFTNTCHKWQSHDVWFLRYEMQQTEFLIILDHFLPFYSPNNLKNQNFEKLRKIPGDIIISHMCTINNNHIWYIVPEIWSVTERIFCHFGPFFAFSPL